MHVTRRHAPIMVSPVARRDAAAPNPVVRAARPAATTGGAAAAGADAGDWVGRIANACYGGWARTKAVFQAVIPGGPKAVGPDRVPADADTIAELHEHRRTWFMSQTHGAYNPAEDTWGNANCGPTSLAMIAKAFGKIAPSRAGADAAIEDARRRIGGSLNERDSTNTSGLVAGARSYGLTATTKKVGSLDDVKAELDAGRLVIASVVPKYLGPLGSGGHFTVVTKIQDGKVYLNDPWKSEGPIVVTEEAFWDALRSRSQLIVPIGRS